MALQACSWISTAAALACAIVPGDAARKLPLISPAKSEILLNVFIALLKALFVVIVVSCLVDWRNPAPSTTGRTPIGVAFVAIRFAMRAFGRRLNSATRAI